MLQSDDVEGCQETQDLIGVIAILGNHEKQLQELEGVEVLEVTATIKETTNIVTLKNGKRMTSRALPRLGELMWSPAQDKVDDTTRQEKESVTAKMKRPRWLHQGVREGKEGIRRLGGKSSSKSGRQTANNKRQIIQRKEQQFRRILI